MKKYLRQNKLLNKIICWFGRHGYYPNEIERRRTDYIVRGYCIYCGDDFLVNEIKYTEERATEVKIKRSFVDSLIGLEVLDARDLITSAGYKCEAYSENTFNNFNHIKSNTIFLFIDQNGEVKDAWPGKYKGECKVNIKNKNYKAEDINSAYHKLYDADGRNEGAVLTAEETTELLDYLDWMSCNTAVIKEKKKWWQW